MNKNSLNKKGFTLIEVLVVIFIIGLLSSVVLVGLGGFRAKGRDTRRIVDLKSVQNPLELYYNKESRYPDANDWESLEDSLMGSSVTKSIPHDPSGNGFSYDYAVSSDGQQYVLRAKLEDSESSLLKEDVDGSGSENFGLDCTDDPTPYYCISFN